MENLKKKIICAVRFCKFQAHDLKSICTKIAKFKKKIRKIKILEIQKFIQLFCIATAIFFWTSAWILTVTRCKPSVVKEAEPKKIKRSQIIRNSASPLPLCSPLRPRSDNKRFFPPKIIVSWTLRRIIRSLSALFDVVRLSISSMFTYLCNRRRQKTRFFRVINQRQVSLKNWMAALFLTALLYPCKSGSIRAKA